MENNRDTISRRAKTILVPMLAKAGYSVTTEVKDDDRSQGRDLETRLIIHTKGSGFVIRFVVTDLLGAPVSKIDRALKRCAREYLEDIVPCHKSEAALNSLADYETIRHRIFIRLQDPDLHPEFKEGFPARLVMDSQMLAVYRVAMNEQAGQNLVSAAISTDTLKLWQITEEQLWEQALENLKREQPTFIHTLHVATSSNLRHPRLNLLLRPGVGRLDPAATYLLCSGPVDRGRVALNGARAVLNDATLEKIGRLLGEDYFILPSSIHEVMITGTSPFVSLEKGVRAMKQTVADANAHTVSEKDLLSYKVFRYDRRKKEIVRAA